MAKYVVNCRFLTQKPTGVQRYALSCALMMQKKFGSEVLFVAPNGKLHESSIEIEGIVRFGSLKYSGHFWEQFLLPIYLKKLSNPVLLCFSGLAPVFYRNTIFCIHDMAIFRYPKTFSTLYGIYYRQMTRLLASRVRKLICVSNFTKSEIGELLGRRDATVVNNTIPKTLSMEIMGSSDLLEIIGDDDFILAVGTLEPRKNLHRLAEAFENASLENVKLVIIGASGAAFRHMEKPWSMSDKIILGGYVSDSELSTLYTKARFFIYPSIYEGFGIPPLEAMSFDCPVVVSSTSSMPEVCGEAGIYFDPFNVELISCAIIKMMSCSATEKNILVENGQKQVETFTPMRQEAQLLKVLNEI